MQTIDLQVLEKVDNWLRGNERCWLCTIVGTVGSSPRPVGSLLACNSTGLQVGSLSGGCVEDDLLQRVREGVLADHSPEIIEYGVTAEENERLGLPCGGRLHVLIEPLTPERHGKEISELLAHVGRRECVLRHLNLETGESSLETCERFQPLQRTDALVSQCFGPQMLLLLVGAGQLAQSLSELALAMDYQVIVTDPRDEVREQWPGPDLELVGGMPDDVIRTRAGDRNSIIITLTHDPRIDDMALMEALETDAAYIGALGSVRTTAKRLARLQELGIGQDELAKLHAPVGLDIGSKTPLEIAISIMAQLTQLRRKGTL